MKKAEMEEHRSRYESHISQAHQAERQGLFREAVASARAAWPFIDGMMQYERRWGDREFSTIPAIDLVLKFTPLLFDHEDLDALEALLKDAKRIERNTSESMADRLRAARARMWDNHGLWDYLERNPDTRQDELRRLLGGDQDYWRSVAEAWEKMGLLRRTPESGSYRLALHTRMDEVISAKCPTCGMIAEAPKAMFLEAMACPSCRKESLFVILCTSITV